MGLAIAPNDRLVWGLETGAALILFVLMRAIDQRVRFSGPAYFMAMAFLAMHLYGAHYTYGETPGPWDLERNYYDRVVHFAAGVLLLPATWEFVHKRHAAGAGWSRAVAVAFLGSAAALFEAGEMFVFKLSTEATGKRYLGTQGDPFDPVWDILMAFLGAGLTLLVVQWQRTIAAARRSK
jgi:putative membrane protein